MSASLIRYNMWQMGKRRSCPLIASLIRPIASLIRYNPWQMGKKKIMPRVARDLYVTDSVDYAAEHDCKVR